MPITDLVFLEGNEPEAVLYNEIPYGKGYWFHAKNIGPTPLAMLGSFLGVASYDELQEGFCPVVPPEGEAVLLNFPQILQDKLREILDSEIQNVVSKWVEIDEFAETASEEDLAEYLKGVRNFLGESKEPVYFFWCV